jgi:hypothetical protein
VIVGHAKFTANRVAAVMWIDGVPSQIVNDKKEPVFGGATDVSEDGRIIVGYDVISHHAFTIEDGGYSLLRPLTEESRWTLASSVSADGTAILGISYSKSVMWQHGQVTARGGSTSPLGSRRSHTPGNERTHRSPPSRRAMARRP